MRRVAALLVLLGALAFGGGALAGGGLGGGPEPEAQASAGDLHGAAASLLRRNASLVHEIGRTANAARREEVFPEDALFRLDRLAERADDHVAEARLVPGDALARKALVRQATVVRKVVGRLRTRLAEGSGDLAGPVRFLRGETRSVLKRLAVDASEVDRDRLDAAARRLR